MLTNAYHQIVSHVSDLCPNISHLFRVSDIVAFHVHTFAGSSVSAGDSIKFKTELFNTGNGYNLDDGVFTSPVSGVYIFTAHFCISKGFNLGYSFVKEEEIIITGTVYGCDGPNCAAPSAVIMLKKNERLTIRCRDGPCQDAFVDDSVGTHTFSGALISRTHP